MEFFQCPHCEKQAVEGWTFFLFFIFFLFSKQCSNCGKTLKL